MYSTTNSSVSRSTSPAVKGRLESSSIFFLSITASKLSAFLYLPSSGFFASTGIFQLRPSRVTPKIFPSEHNIRTLLSEMPHFSAACFTVMYINLHLSSNSSIPYYRNNINSIGIIFSTYRNNTKVRKIPILNLPDHYYALLILVSSIVVKL